MSIIDKKRETDFTVSSRQEGLELKNGYKYMFNSVLGCQYVINVENNHYTLISFCLIILCILF